MASGKYVVTELGGYIFEIQLSKSGHDRVACFYLHDKVDVSGAPVVAEPVSSEQVDKA